MATRFMTVLAFVALALPAGNDGFISEQHLRKHVEILSSDAFGGRAPGSAGELLTLAYLEEQFRSLGYEPAGDDEPQHRGSGGGSEPEHDDGDGGFRLGASRTPSLARPGSLSLSLALAACGITLSDLLEAVADDGGRDDGDDASGDEGHQREDERQTQSQAHRRAAR